MIFYLKEGKIKENMRVLGKLYEMYWSKTLNHTNLF
jgi:hypothetical protein